MSLATLNAKTYTYYNVPARGEVGGWCIDSSGRPDPYDASEGAETGTMRANIQPFSGTLRRRESAGTVDVNRIMAWVAPVTGTTFPPLYAAENTERRLASVVSYDGILYEIQRVKTWSRGLLPHMYFEATRLVMRLGTDDPPDWEP